MAGLGETLASLLRQADALAHALFPAGFLLLLMVLASLPLGLPGMVPAVILPCVFFWSVFRPTALPPLLVFGMGLLQDLLTQAPLGASVLVLLLAQGLVLRWHGSLAKLSFPALWLVYGLFASGGALLTWALHALLGWRLMPFMPALQQAALTSGLYPSIAFILSRANRMLNQPEGPVQRRPPALR